MKTLQRTFSIIKPDAVAKGAAGDILKTLQEKGFRIIGMKMLEITKEQAEGFYAVHATKPFFGSLTDFMSSGPIVVLALEKDNAIAELRELMGATNPANAKEGTIRKKWRRASNTMPCMAPTPTIPRALSSAIFLPDMNWQNREGLYLQAIGS